MVGQSTGVFSPILEYWRLKKAVKWIRGKRIVDIGCGSAKISTYLSKKAEYTGIESNNKVLKKVRRKFPKRTFIHMSVNERTIKKLKTNNIDTLIMLAFIEHIDHPDRFLRAVKGKLRPGGRVILTTPTAAAERILKFGAKLGLFSSEAFHEHKNHFSKADLFGLCKESGYGIIHYSSFELGFNHFIVLES